MAASFDGASTDLERTVILATLDEPIPAGKNAVWCASFVAAWKEMEDFNGQPVVLQDSPSMADSLNQAADPRPAIPADALYTKAGPGGAALDQIEREVAQKFPGVSLSLVRQLPPLDPQDLVAYAYLQAEVPFAIPYFQNDEPLMFTDSRGTATEVGSFGIRKRDAHGYRKLHEQARVVILREEPVSEGLVDPPMKAVEYAVDLCVSSSPSQIVVACISPEDTLQAAVDRVQRAMAEAEEVLRQDPQEAWRFQLRQPLLVPDLAWKILHRFVELEDQVLANGTLAGPITFAGQHIDFRLSRSGAELKSEAAVAVRASAEEFDCVFNRPFLIYMKQRGAGQPYFAMWIDNAELLQPW
jgi:hypothetical protein